MVRKVALISLVIIGLISFTPVSGYLINIEGSGHIYELQTGTRKSAMLDYIEALYSYNEGAFYGYLKDWPTDSRIHSYHTLTDLYRPLTTLSYLSSLNYIDLSNCSVFAKSLLNMNEMADYYGPVNYSRDTPCSVISCEVAYDVYNILNLSGYLPLDDLVDFVVLSQGESGGFQNDIWGELPEEELVNTQVALSLLNSCDAIDLIDSEAALSFIISCYSEGGFSYVPDGYVELGAMPLALMCLDYLGELKNVDKNGITEFILSQWDNETGSVPDGTIVDTERAVWSLYLLNELDQVDINATIEWVLSCQSMEHGGFLHYPDGESIDERLEWTRAAVHILYLLDQLDVLDVQFSVYARPTHIIPQGYYDFIREYVDTTSNPSAPHFPLPNVDFVAIFLNIAPGLAILSVILLPAAYFVYQDRRKKAIRQELKKKRNR